MVSCVVINSVRGAFALGNSVRFLDAKTLALMSPVASTTSSPTNFAT